LLISGRVDVSSPLCVHFDPCLTWPIMSISPAMKLFFSVRFIGLNEHGLLTNWMIIRAPLAGLLKSLGYNLMVWLSVPFLFSCVVFMLGLRCSRIHEMGNRNPCLHS
jgi:hypothetical protein